MDVDEECRFQVTVDPARAMAAFRAARTQADRVRSALDAAGLSALTGQVRGAMNETGDPIVTLQASLAVTEIDRLVAALEAAPGRRVDGAA